MTHHPIVQAALSRAASSLHEAFQRFPEFSEISLQSVLVEHPTDEGETISCQEPLLEARHAGGEWLGLEQNADVCAMNSLLDWNEQMRGLIFRATRWGGPIVFDRAAMTVESIEQRLNEGMQQLPRSGASFAVG